MLQDSPLSSAQPLHQVPMMPVIPCPCSPSSPLFTKWGSCTGCMWCHHPASCLVCPLVCPLHYPVALIVLYRCMPCHPVHSLVFPLVCPLHYPIALYKVHLMSSSQLFCSFWVSNTLSSVYHSCSCYLLNKKEILTWIFTFTNAHCII